MLNAKVETQSQHGNAGIVIVDPHTFQLNQPGPVNRNQIAKVAGHIMGKCTNRDHTVLGNHMLSRAST